MKFRIATWNLDHASRESRPIAGQLEKIKQINADVIVLTETCPQVDLSGMGYESRASALNDYKKNCSVVWSKWPIEQAIDTYDAETAVCGRVKSPFGSLIIYGTILTYHGDRGPDNTSGPWEEHHKEIVRQGTDWCAIQSQFKSVAFIVAGDFNQTRDGSSRYRSSRGVQLLDEQLVRNNLKCLTEEDFGANGKLTPHPKKGSYRHNIDHICISEGHFKAKQVGAWDHFTATQELSDHNGIFVDLMPTVS